VGSGIPIVPKHVRADVADPLKYQDPKALIVPASNELLALQRGELDVASHGVGGGKIDFPIAQASLDALDKTRYGQVTAPGVSGAILHFNITKVSPTPTRGSARRSHTRSTARTW